MRNIRILIPALALAGFIGASIAAQQPATSPSPSTPHSTPAQSQNDKAAAAVPVSSTAGAPEASNQQLRPVTGELEKKIDTKNAKPGDPVIVKTTEQATIADGTVIPKGSRIVGHVTNVQAHSKTNPNARLTIQFDQAEIKGGHTLPIRTLLVSVAPAPTTVHPTDTPNSPGMGSMPMQSPSAAGSPTGSAHGSGAQTTPPPGGDAPTMSAATEQQATTAQPKSGTVVSRQGDVAIKTTALPGVLLATNINGQPFSNAAGALLGARQNVHLDGGTQIVLAVMDAPQKPGTR